MLPSPGELVAVRSVAVERSRSSSAALTIIALLGVAAGYYLGGLLGLQIRIPPSTPSILWPPNAILTAALLLTPPRRWGLVLLAALPAHMIAELPTGWPLALILWLFVTNCSEALIAAGGVWLFSDAPTRIDTLRRLFVFLICAVLLAPWLSSFFDAAVVNWFRGESYWVVWRNRFAANVLAELTIVPAIVSLLSGVRVWMRRVSIARCIEATLLCTLLVITSLLVVTYPIQNVAFQAVSIEAPLALQLPFILWAALRFGTAGASLTLLVTTILSSWAVGHGHGQFQTLSPGASVLALQTVLIIVGVTFLTLATIIEERRQTERALSERLRFEELLARASATFIEPPSDRLDAVFVAWLERVGNFLAVDSARLYRLSDDRDNLELTSAWAAPGFGPVPPFDVKRDFPWVLQRILNRESVIIGRGRTLPAHAPIDRGSLELFGFKSVLVLPLIAGNRVLGAIGFGTPDDRTWPENLLTSLHLLSDVFANAFVRKQTEDALRASELMKSAILDSMTSGIAVIDPDGCVRAVNRSWKQFVDETDIQPAKGLHLGENLLAGLRASPIARVSDLVAGAESVLDGSREHFIFEHVSQAGGVSRWWTMQAVCLKGPNAGAIVNINEITDFRLAEREAQRSRQELAHVTRVSTMGVLTVALAHQLNQPLGAIMSNAQAARRLLAKTPPDLGEVDEILADIVSDDRRASDVIRHVREFLHKGDRTVESVDLTAVIRDVAALLSGDAAIRNVVMTLDVAQTPLMVRADLIQLQQVLLNLLLNALESIEDSAAIERNVLIRCQGSNGTAGEVSIRDSGAGFSPEARDLLFEPFFTTKPAGTGMGLSIARSILDAHGGTIRAYNAEGGGAIVEFSLPLDRLTPA